MFLKNLLNPFREVDEMLDELEQEAARYCAMTREELAALSDEDFTVAIDSRICEKVEKEGIDALIPEARNYYVVASYDLDHCGYARSELDLLFDPAEMAHAPELCNAFAAVGAGAYRDLFARFVKENKLDLLALQRMSERELKKTLRKCRVFKGKDFDRLYDELQERKPLGEITDRYLIANRELLQQQY